MKAKIIQEKDNQIAIYDEKDKLLKRFELKESLQRSLTFLKQINSLKTIKGLPIYQTKTIEGISVWAFFQTILFRDFLWDYPKYEEIIRFLFNNKIREVFLKNKESKLKFYLEQSEIKIINDFKQILFLKPLFKFFLKLIAWIISLLAIGKIIISKISLLVYTPDKYVKKYDCDPRFFVVYQYLKEKEIKFLEVLHTSFGIEFLINILQRRRFVFYIEAFPLFFIKRKSYIENYDLSIFEIHRQIYIKNILKIIDQESAKSIIRVKILIKLLKLTKIKTLLGIDDVRSINELILACKINKIKTYGFQHGQFSKYHVGWMNYNIPKKFSITFDKLFVWSDYSKKILLNYSNHYNENNIIVGGALKEFKLIEYQKKEISLPLKILIPYESGAPKLEVRYYLDKLISFGSELYFKPRPDLPIKFQLKEYQLENLDKIKIVKEINKDILLKIDAAAGTYSTLLYEMIFYEKPIFLFKTSLDLGHQLIKDDLCFLLKKDFKIEDLINYIKNYKSKKDKVWPISQLKLRDALEKLNL